MVDLIEKVEGVILTTRWANLGALIGKNLTTDESVKTVKFFLETVEGAIRSREGEVKHSLPDRVTAFFPIAGKVTDSETRAVECARRMLMEFRRYNAKQPVVPIDVTSAITTGPFIIAPGIAEVQLNSLVIGEPISTADRMLQTGKPDTVLVTELTYARISFAYKGRPVEGQSPKMFELVL
jgi:class 3 adenylate cyclase